MLYEIRKDPDDEFRQDLWRINDDGSETLLGSDAGEPEDNLFCRDWKWVLPELNALADTIARAKETCGFGKLAFPESDHKRVRLRRLNPGLESVTWNSEADE